MSKPKTPKGKPGPKPVLYVRLTESHEAALNALIASQRYKPDRTAIGLTALEELLAREGFWPWTPKEKK